MAGQPSIRDSSNVSNISRDLSTNKGLRRRKDNNTMQIVEESLTSYKEQVGEMINQKMNEIGNMQDSQDKQMGQYGKDIYEFRIFLDQNVKQAMDGMK